MNGEILLKYAVTCTGVSARFLLILLLFSSFCDGMLSTMTLSVSVFLSLSVNAATCCCKIFPHCHDEWSTFVVMHRL